MHIGVIYAMQTGVIRRVITTTDRRSLNRFVRATAPGEAYVEVPRIEYDRMQGPADLMAWLAARAPERYHWRGEDGQCVEVDALGRVVAAYCADPAIDRPLSPHNRMHKGTASVGMLKVGDTFL